MFLVSGLDLKGPGVAIAPLLSPILLQGKDVEGGVNRLVVGGSTGICITTVWVRATWMGWIRRAGLVPPGARELRGPRRQLKDGGEKHRTQATRGVSMSGDMWRFFPLQHKCWLSPNSMLNLSFDTVQHHKLLKFSLEVSQSIFKKNPKLR